MSFPAIVCKCDRCGQPLQVTRRGRFVPCPCAQVVQPVKPKMPRLERPERPRDLLLDDDP